MCLHGWIAGMPKRDGQKLKGVSSDMEEIVDNPDRTRHEETRRVKERRRFVNVVCFIHFSVIFILFCVL